jgi:C_GCAxxG_C_C family probable redox protein
LEIYFNSSRNIKIKESYGVAQKNITIKGGYMDAQAIEASVYKYFKSGYHCAEVISKTILENISPPSKTAQVVKVASGFGGGIAGAMTELCGAFSGGVLTVGALYGRQYPDEDLADCGSLIIAYRNYFKDEFGSLNCPTIIEHLGPDNLPLGCAHLTARATVVLLEMLGELDAQRPTSIFSGDGHRVAKADSLRCPFESAHDALSA